MELQNHVRDQTEYCAPSKSWEQTIWMSHNDKSLALWHSQIGMHSHCWGIQEIIFFIQLACFQTSGVANKKSRLLETFKIIYKLEIFTLPAIAMVLTNVTQF